MGDVKKSTLEEIWSSEKMKALRREFLEGNPKTCAKHMSVNGCHLIRNDLLSDVELNESPAFPMKRLDLMINGKCNLECKMCDIWKMPNDVYTKNGFWEEGHKKIFPFLKEIDCKGGEPFIQRDIFRLMDEVSEVNSECLWHFTTNGHYRLNEKMISHLDKIKIVRVSLSIDSLSPKTFADIRKNGRLTTVLEALNDWIDYREGAKGGSRFQLCVNMVVQRDNWREVTRFINFCRGKKETHPFFIPLIRPSKFSIFGLLEEQRAEILEYYLKFMKLQKEESYLRLIKPIAASLNPSSKKVGFVSSYDMDMGSPQPLS